MATSDNGSPFSEDQADFLAITVNVTTAVSLIALFMFFLSTYILKPENSFSMKLVSNLFIADLIYTVSNILSNFSNNNYTICQIEGFLKTFALWASILWSTMIGYTTYYTVVKNSINMHKKYPLFFIISYGWPLLFGILPYIPGISFYYENNGAICWIATDTDYVVLIKCLYFFVWAWATLIYVTILYIKLFRYLQNMNLNTMVLEYRQVIIYPIILYLSMIPITVSNIILSDKICFPVTVVELFTLHIIGLLDVFAYGFQRLVGLAKKGDNDIKQDLLQNTNDDTQRNQSENDTFNSGLGLNLRKRNETDTEYALAEAAGL